MKWISLKESLEHYRTSAATMRRWLKQGKIEGKKIGKKWLIPIEPENVLANASDPMLKTLFQNALKDFANDCIDECSYITGEDEIEFHSDKLELMVNRYTDLLQKLLIWKGGE